MKKKWDVEPPYGWQRFWSWVSFRAFIIANVRKPGGDADVEEETRRRDYQVHFNVAEESPSCLGEAMKKDVEEVRVTSTRWDNRDHWEVELSTGRVIKVSKGVARLVFPVHGAKGVEMLTVDAPPRPGEIEVSNLVVLSHDAGFGHTVERLPDGTFRHTLKPARVDP